MPGASPVQIAGSEATLRGSLAYVTTLLASVGRCSRPERIHQEIRCFATTLLASVERCSGREHGSTLASSVVAEEVAGRGDVWF